LEIEHPDTDEIGAILKGILESLFGKDSASRQDLETNPEPLDPMHDLDTLLGNRSQMLSWDWW
jgi:hypothetical protein